MDEGSHYSPERYSLRQVRQITGIRPSALRQLIASGFVLPDRGKRREYRFGFRDLIVLRMAKGLWETKLSSRKIASSLRRLRRQLPAEPPAAGLRIAAMGNEVVVSEGDSRWQAGNGQYLLAFDVTSTEAGIAFALCGGEGAGAAPDWFARALDAETTDVAAAMESYARASAENPCHPGAYVNWGRLLHAAGRLADAEEIYRRGAGACPDDALLLFNLAVLCEDQGRQEEALALYKRSLALDAGMYDAHYNLALLYETSGRPRDAVRHFSAYRKLVAASGPRV